MLLSARAKLRATPERPKRRHSAIGAPTGLDMTALMTEVGAKRQKLRKVGLPKEQTQEELRLHKTGQAGAVEAGLRSALKRSSARQSDAAPPTETLSRKTLLRRASELSGGSLGPIPTIRGSAAPGALEGRTGVAASASAPGVLSPTPTETPHGGHAAVADEMDLSRHGMEEDVGGEPVACGSGDVASLGIIELVRVGTAELAKEDGTADLSGIAGHDEAVVATGSEHESTRSLRMAVTAPSSPATANGGAATNHYPLSSPIDRSSSGARPRQRSMGEKLPGLDLTRGRPVTPGRQKAKANRARQSSPLSETLAPAAGLGHPPDSSGSNVRPPLSPRPNATEPSAIVSLPKPRRARRVAVPRAVEPKTGEKPEPIEDLLATAGSTLSGVGTKDPDPARVFGRA